MLTRRKLPRLFWRFASAYLCLLLCLWAAASAFTPTGLSPSRSRLPTGSAPHRDSRPSALPSTSWQDVSGRLTWPPSYDRRVPIGASSLPPGWCELDLSSGHTHCGN